LRDLGGGLVVVSGVVGSGTVEEAARLRFVGGGPFGFGPTVGAASGIGEALAALDGDMVMNLHCSAAGATQCRRGRRKLSVVLGVRCEKWDEPRCVASRGVQRTRD
jgi:hypothetical protein